jgi:indole-3-glycerol phosphate synthase
MNILDTIIAHKQIEVAQRKATTSVQQLQANPLFGRSSFSLQQFLLDDTKTGIIAEFKRQSPSKGVINNTADVLEVTDSYTRNFATGLSVLTDHHFFGGSTEDLLQARKNNIPILRKDFIVDEYQIIESKAMGADVILLIAACLSPATVKRLASTAKNIGLEILLELHAEEELVHICDDTMLIGVNNRNLKTFEVDIHHSLKMAEKIPASKIKITESGIDSLATIQLFKENGFKGFLMGEKFMKSENPSLAFAKFSKAVLAEKMLKR